MCGPRPVRPCLYEPLQVVGPLQLERAYRDPGVATQSAVVGGSASACCSGACAAGAIDTTGRACPWPGRRRE
jgi:hypothetical protein